MLQTSLSLLSSATIATQSICPFAQSPLEAWPVDVSNFCWNRTVTTPFDSSIATTSGEALFGHSTFGSSYSKSTVQPEPFTAEFANSIPSVGELVGNSVGDDVGPDVGANVGLFVG